MQFADRDFQDKQFYSKGCTIKSLTDSVYKGKKRTALRRFALIAGKAA